MSVCFPAYNEEASLRGVLEEAHALLSASGLRYEVVVCDDGSTDATPAILDELSARMPRLRVLSHSRNLGIRATFEDLYAEAREDFVFLNSTDGQWSTAILFDILPLTEHWDIIVASRLHKHYGPARRFVSWCYNAIPPLLFGVRTLDAGAVKLARREAIQCCTPISRSPFAEAERLIRAARAGYRITAYPVRTYQRQSGRARGASPRLVAQALADVARVWWSLSREARAHGGAGVHRSGGHRRDPPSDA